MGDKGWSKWMMVGQLDGGGWKVQDKNWLQRLSDDDSLLFGIAEIG